ncbi:chaperone modulator CbpM [Streptomyces bobili]|uniref:chaperone modulator CbpM n=1 Tax=Streptomyces bobili TaxID=67280 RepID=UPI003710DC87
MSARQRPPAVPSVQVVRAGAGYPLVRIDRADPYPLSLDSVAHRSGLSPDLVRRFVALGLLDARRDAFGGLRFRSSAPSAIARVQRLRIGLSLNYAAIGLVMDLLDRIEGLESELRHRERAAEE